MKLSKFLFILLTGCASVLPVTGKSTLILRPEISNGSVTRAALPFYTRAAIDHLTLKLYTVEGGETYTGVSRTLSNAQLDNPVQFSNLKANTQYRVRAYAYVSLDDSQLISTTDASSYADVSVLADDRPTMATLNVKLIDRAFDFQSTSSLNIIPGGLIHLGDPDSQVLGISGNVTTFVGTGGAANTEGTGTGAAIKAPQFITLDPQGNFYVTCSNRVRKITPEGVTSTLAGSDAAGTSDGQGASAAFTAPRGVAFDNANNLYVADGNRIRRITQDGTVDTVAGLTTTGTSDGYGTAATFNSIYGIAFDGQHYLYVADQNNRLVRRIDPQDNFKVETYAGSISGYADGTGTAAKFYLPYDIVSDGKGHLYLTEYSSAMGAGPNSRIRMIDLASAYVSTVAGMTVGGVLNEYGTSAKLSVPKGITLDRLGNLYFVDSRYPRIRKVASNKYVSHVAGAGIIGISDGVGSVAKFSSPTGVAMDASGTLYVADTNNNCIRKIQ